MFDLPLLDPGIEIVVASRGMSKGVSQTDGPQGVAKTFVQLGPVQLGGQWKNVTSTSADGEAAAYVNAVRSFGSVQVSFGLAYKFQTGVIGNPDSGAWELSAGATRKFGKFSIRLNGIYSPNDLGTTRRSLYLEGGPVLEIDKTTRLSANLGRRWRQASPDYTSFNGGVTKTLFPGFAIDARYFDTAQSELGEPFRGRIVVSGRWSL